MGLGTPKVEQVPGHFHFGTPYPVQTRKTGVQLGGQRERNSRSLDLYLGVFIEWISYSLPCFPLGVKLKEGLYCLCVCLLTRRQPLIKLLPLSLSILYSAFHAATSYLHKKSIWPFQIKFKTPLRPPTAWLTFLGGCPWLFTVWP